MNKHEYSMMYKIENTHFWFIGKRMFIHEFLKKTNKPVSPILDIGCGTGGTTHWLHTFGRVTALESNKFASTLARKRKLNIIEGRAEKLPFASKSFRLVTIFDVLYHRNIQRVETVLQEAVRVLRPGGYLLITDSAFPWLRSKHDRYLGGRRRFTLHQIRQYMKQYNLHIVKSSYVFFSIFPLVFIQRMLIERIIPKYSSDVFPVPSLLNNLLVFILRIEAVLLSMMSFPVGSSVIMLAQKQ